MRSVFRRKEALSPRYVPKTLPHRQPHLNMLRSLFSDFLEKPMEAYQKVVQIFGPTGSGKTCTAMRFGMELEGEAVRRGIKLRFIHVNCKLGVDSTYALYQTILQKVSPESLGRGYSPSEMLRQTMLHLRRTGEYMLLAVDDVDYLVRTLKEKRGEGGVIFDLTRLNEMYLGEEQRVAGVIFIAKDASFRELLDPAEVSTLGSVILRLPPYTGEQLAEILAERVEEAFRPGAVGEEVIEFVADLAAGKQYNPGDCRFALDILLTAGIIADSEWADSVRLDHVRIAAAEWFDGISTEDLMELDEHELLVLRATADALRLNDKAYVTVKEIWEYYETACAAKEVKPLSYEKVKEYVRDLHCRGLVHQSKKGVSVVGAPVRDLSRVIPTIERGERLEWRG
jgi:cell division control protein 6